jgi:glutamate dehydrogenase (NAD) (EC 1.4.1.2)
VELATEVFFDLLDRLDLNWFASQLSNVKVENYWQALARESYLDELDSHLRRLTIALVSSMESTQQDDIAAVLDACFGENESLVVRWRRMITEVQSSSATDYAMFSVALRELLDLVVATDHYAQKIKG